MITSNSVALTKVIVITLSCRIFIIIISIIIITLVIIIRHTINIIIIIIIIIIVIIHSRYDCHYYHYYRKGGFGMLRAGRVLVKTETRFSKCPRKGSGRHHIWQYAGSRLHAKPTQRSPRNPTTVIIVVIK